MRENRTSGTVRGALGNWRSYRERSGRAFQLNEESLMGVRESDRLIVL